MAWGSTIGRKAEHDTQRRLHNCIADSGFNDGPPVSDAGASTEKVCDLPRPLMTRGAPDGFEPSAGDVAYYAPWGNLAIFYEDTKHSKDLVQLGRVDTGLELLRVPDFIEAVLTLRRR